MRFDEFKKQAFGQALALGVMVAARSLDFIIFLENRITEAAALVGELVGKRAVEAGVKQVVFDRGGYLYTGRVAAVAAGAREAGLDF